MKVCLGSKRVIVRHYVEVASLRDAALKVRQFIEEHDCTAGCGSDFGSFVGGEILEDDEVIARVSYNGRVWDLNQQEVKI